MIDFSLIKNIEGWCSEEKSNKMYDLIINTKPKTIVEIGVFGGKSLLPQAFALKENGMGIIHGVDSWQKEDCVRGMKSELDINWWSSIDYDKIYDGCVNGIKENNLQEYVKLHRMSSEEYSFMIDYSIDILHIDGNHEEESSCRDVQLYFPKVVSGGYIWLDDINWKQMQRAVTMIEKEYGCKFIDNARSTDLFDTCNLYQKI